MKNGISISIYSDGELYEYRYDADLEREFKVNLDIMLEQYLRFKAIECTHLAIKCTHFMQEGQ